MKFDVENELVDFNLERMGHKGKANLIKVAELLGTLDGDSWGVYIEHGYIEALVRGFRSGFLTVLNRTDTEYRQLCQSENLPLL